MRPAWTNEHRKRNQQDEQIRNEVTRGLPVIMAQGDGWRPLGPLPDMPPSVQVDVNNQRGIADHFNEQVFAELHERFRVLSLVRSLPGFGVEPEEPDDRTILMWSHYADQFQGVCLGLDPTKFDNGITQGGYVVQYPTERQSLPEFYYDTFHALFPKYPEDPRYPYDPASKLLLSPVDHHALRRHRFIELLRYKSPAWEHENELRMLYELDRQSTLNGHRPILMPCPDCQLRCKEIEECKYPCYRDTIELPPESIRAIIFGTECTLRTVDAIFSVLEDARYANVETYWSDLHSSKYAIHYVKDERNDLKTLLRAHSHRIARSKGHVRHGPGDKLIALHSPKGMTYCSPNQNPAAE